MTKTMSKTSAMKLFSAAIGLAWSLFSQVSYAASSIGSDLKDSHGTFRLGTLSFSKSDGENNRTGQASVMNYEYSRYFRTNQALVLGFRQGTDGETKRDAYHSAYAGYRIFPLGVGLPMVVSTGDSTISMDARYKPYAETSLGLGRILFEPVSGGAGEFASDTIGFSFGGGLMMHFFNRWAVDLELLYEMVQGRGGTGNSLSITGNNVYILLGSGLLF